MSVQIDVSSMVVALVSNACEMGEGVIDSQLISGEIVHPLYMYTYLHLTGPDVAKPLYSCKLSPTQCRQG